MFKKKKTYEEIKKEDDEAFEKLREKLNSITDEQYENERKFHTTFEEELANFATILAKRKADGDIVETSDE